MNMDFDKEVQMAVGVLRRGGLILYPTDTIWGIGADATIPQAIEQIYRLKRRSDSKSMLALLADEYDLYKWLANVPEKAIEYVRGSTKPLTIIYDSPRGIAHNLLADDGSLGIRITLEKFSAAICSRLGHPIVSTSANISGQPAPAIFRDISEEIIDGVDYTPFYRRDDETPRQPSGIIKLTDDGKVTVIR